MATEPTASGQHPTMVCPGCGKLTGEICSYRGPTFVFLVVWVAWAWTPIEACRHCCQRLIWHHLGLNILTANLFCFMTVPWWFALVLYNKYRAPTGLPEHYHANLEAYRERGKIIAEAKEERATKARQFKENNPNLGFVILLALIVIIVFMFFVLPALVGKS